MRNLRTEKEIMQKWQGDPDKPLVSICCITYNHEPFIEDALEGFLIQETDFPFEILIHDDASPDGTAEIIQEYHDRYPKLIKPIYQEENQYSKGVQVNPAFNFPRAKGKYIAMCEGDDYWTDSGKLKKQIGFLEENKNFIGTAHNVRVIDEYDKPVDDKLNYYKIFPSYIYTINDAEKFKLPGQTASVIYRNIWKNISDEKFDLYCSCQTNGDQKLSLLLALQGNIYCFSDIMADHRKIISGGTSWSARTYGKNKSLYSYTSLIEINKFAQDAFGVTLNNKKQRLNTFYSAVTFFIKHPNKENWLIIKEILALNIDKHSELFFHVLTRLLSWPIRRVKRLID